MVLIIIKFPQPNIMVSSCSSSMLDLRRGQSEFLSKIRPTPIFGPGVADESKEKARLSFCIFPLNPPPPPISWALHDAAPLSRSNHNLWPHPHSQGERENEGNGLIDMLRQVFPWHQLTNDIYLHGCLLVSPSNALKEGKLGVERRLDDSISRHV